MHANTALEIPDVPKMEIYKYDAMPRMKMISVTGNSGGVPMLEAWYDFIENLFFYETNNNGRVDGSTDRIEGQVKMYFYDKNDVSSELVQSYLKNFLQMRISPYHAPRRQLIELTEPFGLLPIEVLEGYINSIQIFIGHHSIEFSYEFEYKDTSYSSPRLVVMESLFGHTVVLPSPNMYIGIKE